MEKPFPTQELLPFAGQFANDPYLWTTDPSTVFPEENLHWQIRATELPQWKG